MRLLIPTLLALTGVTAATASAALGPPAKACGVERWAVKTLMDPAAAQVRLLPAKTTVAKLRHLAVSRGAGDSRGKGAESLTYEVTAKLVAAKVEDDSDVHLVIADAQTGGLMIVEFPHPSCALQAPAALRRRMTRARNDFFRACGIPSNSDFSTLKGTATIRGVGFFDFIHGQRGHAPNGIELHPALFFKAASCAATRSSRSATSGFEEEDEPTRAVRQGASQRPSGRHPRASASTEP